MLIGRVIGDLTSTQKHASHEGCKLLLVQPLQLDGSNRGTPVIAVDSVEAGIGDRVLLVQDGYAAMSAIGRPQSPIDMAIVGVVDHVEITSNAAPVVTQVNPRMAKKSNKKHER